MLNTIPDRFRARPLALLRYLPGLALGLFLARIIGEWIGMPGLWAAVAVSLALAIAGGWLLGRWAFERTWPALILLIYVVYPEVYFPLAGRVIAVALIAVGLNSVTLRPVMDQDRFAPIGRPVLLTAALLTAAFFILYLVTLAPDVLPADGGELQVVAAQLGVAHPPGFPLYVMLAHLLTRLLPFVAPAYAVNLFSAVTSALTVGVVYLGGVALTRGSLAGLIGAIALGTAATFWSQATTANVRSLTGLFAALILFALIQFRTATERGDRSAADRRLALTALFAGFGLTHHVSLLFLIAVGLLFVVVVDRSLVRTPRRWARPIIVGLLGLLPLLYLPLRAGAGVRGASADLATVAGFLEHTLATGFRGDLFDYLTPADFWQRLLIMGNVMTFQFAIIVLVGMLVGLILLIKRDRPSALLLGGTFGVYTLVAATYRAPQTVEYMIPAYVAAALVLAYAVGRLPDQMGRFGWIGQAAGVLFTALIIVGTLGQFGRNLSASGASHEADTARDYAERLLAEAPPDSVILAHWHWATPLWYLQEVEGARPHLDVRFIFPEGEPYETTWERRTTEAYADGQSVITTWVPAIPLTQLPVPEPVGEALLYPQSPRTALPPGFTPVELALGNEIEVLGYRVEQPTETLAAGEQAVITLAWQAGADLPVGLGLFLHFVGADGVLYGQDDRPALAAEGITLTQFRVTPRPGTPMEALSIYVGAADGAADNRQILAEIDITRSTNAPFTRNKVQRAQLNDAGDTLIGYDWDRTLAERSRLYLHWKNSVGGFSTQVVDAAAVSELNLPLYRGPWGMPVGEWEFPRGRDGGHYVPLGQGIVWTGETLNGLSPSPGESIVVDQELHSSWPVNRDYVVSVRLIGLEPDGVHWAWWDLQDSIPAMGAIPTLKWIEGSFVRSPHRVTVAETAPVGQALTGALTLYDAFTGRQLPILDERMTAENPWIPLCTATVAD